MDKKPKAYTKKQGRDDSSFWDSEEMPLRHSLEASEVIRIVREDGREEVVKKATEFKWKPSAEFVKVFDGRLWELGKKLNTFGEVLFVFYLIERISSEQDYIDLDIQELTEYLRYKTPKSTYRTIDRFVKLGLIEKRNGGKQRYGFNPYVLYKGVYPKLRVENAIKIRKEKIKNDKEANRKNANTKPDRAEDL